ncbi:cation diffusion facilitator family transporter [Ekhidna lutea]|uniref:cation diffusion facilitator family transporter n=1 Tax=Ekhidna lutea TaxID=447679 RepID=UPI000B7999FD|nr:cation diffusion facilitator family transporter [Ekhidna lutea]
MGHSHHHHDHSEGNIKVAFFLNLGFAIIELIGGLWTNSVAILSDALHDLGDSLTLGVSWYFAKVAKKDRNQKYSYGYKRFSVLGALINSIVLVTGSAFIIIEAIPRLFDPIQPNTQGMIYLAIGGVIVNGAAAFKLSKGSSLNEKAVYMHLLEDVLGWIAVLIGAIVMHFWDLPIIDPSLSVLIAIFILYNVFKNLRESFRIILQGTPSDINVKKIHATIKDIPKVLDVHDCHTWSLDGEYHILSIHIVIADDLPLSQLETIKTETKKRVSNLGISHTTIEFETKEEDCDPC